MSKSLNQKTYVFALLLIGVIVNSAILLVYGQRPDLYDVRVYVNGADYLLEVGSFESVHHVFYGLHVAIIAFSRLLVPGEILPVIIFQMILAVLATVALYHAAYKLFKNRYAAFLSGLVFLFWWDCLHWNGTVMSESLFCSLTILIIYLLVHFDNRKTDFARLAIAMLALCFTRPTFIVVVVGLAAYFLFSYWNYLRALSMRKKLLSASVLAMISLLGATLMFQKWDFTVDYISGEVVTYMSTVQESSLYHETLHTPLANASVGLSDSKWGIVRITSFIIDHPGYFFTLAIKKVYYLLTFQRPYYSTWHNLFSALWMAMMYSCFVIGFLHCTHRPIKAFVITVIIVNCLLIGISSVDWDNRFYIPMEPGIVLFAGFGAYKVLGEVSGIFSSEK
ncbi:MAG: hypothetical protein RIC35_00920 [Marinoscillum sp.]